MRLGADDVAAVCAAVETCAQAGMTDDDVRASLHDYRRRFPPGQWRQRFWTTQVRIASLRFNHPHIYGPTPCAAAPDAAPAAPMPATTPVPPAAAPEIHPAVAAAPILAALRAA
jgi:hypothetical protein